MRFAKKARERHEKYLFPIFVAHVQRPRSPIVRTETADEVLHNLGGALMRLNEILDVDATRIEHQFFRAGAMEINVRHGRLRLALANDAPKTLNSN
jgi:hypothetical protein